jgi:hypothetical protein
LEAAVQSVPPVIGANPIQSNRPEAACQPPPLPLQHGFRLRRRYVVLLMLLCLPLFGAAGVASYFRLSSQTRALRGSLMRSIPGQWDKRFAVNLGGFTLGAVRYGSRFFHMPPEPRAALEALHAAEVGVYRLQDQLESLDYNAVFLEADKSMRARGWERVVAVTQPRGMVMVYVPRKGISTSRMSCCVMVLQERDLVIASARGDLEPLLELAEKRLPASLAELSRK